MTALIADFAAQLTDSLGLMAGEMPVIEIEADQALPNQTDMLVWEQRFTLEGAIAYFVGSRASWIGTGSRLLIAAGIDSVDDPTAKSTFTEVLTQAFSRLSRALSLHLKKDVSPTAGAEIPAAPEMAWQKLAVRFSNGEPDFYWVAVNERLTHVTVPGVERRDPLELTEVMEGQAIPTVERARTLDVLMDVELPVSVSFGRAQLPLKDVIKLTTGSIVELNRTIGEPVEVIVNNCVIARGEVVVVEGNFGVRIQQVISKQERLRTLY